MVRWEEDKDRRKGINREQIKEANIWITIYRVR